MEKIESLIIEGRESIGKSNNGHTLYRIIFTPRNSMESKIVRDIKTDYIAKGFIEEVGIFCKVNDTITCPSVDLYNPSTGEAIEIRNCEQRNHRRYVERLHRYKEIFGNIKIILIGDHPIITSNLVKEGFEVLECHRNIYDYKYILSKGRVPILTSYEEQPFYKKALEVLETNNLETNKIYEAILSIDKSFTLKRTKRLLYNMKKSKVIYYIKFRGWSKYKK